MNDRMDERKKCSIEKEKARLGTNAKKKTKWIIGSTEKKNPVQKEKKDNLEVKKRI